ncbi:MAG: OmpA family protein [Gammaproteobacteria bacterium]|nr:OmpA family protein [Gammaproteobacteria bacterium]
MDDVPVKKPDEGLPAWVMTFADLMSLLMCFFVLLLSFSEMDLLKFKQLAGSMSEAFGVQREIKVKEPPKGVNVIATEFSAGRPDPTPLNEVRQSTTNDLKQHLDMSASKYKISREGEGDMMDRGKRQGDEKAYALEQLEDIQAHEKRSILEQLEAIQAHGKQFAQEQMENMSPRDKEYALASLEAQQSQEKKFAIEQLEGKQAQEKQLAVEQFESMQAGEQQQKLDRNADDIRNALKSDIESGAVEVDTEQLKIIIRIKEQASFPSARAELRDDFLPILARVTHVLMKSKGKIVVAGHTDDIPIHNERFRSNWELSAARAVSVVQEILATSSIPAERLLIEGHAETMPLVPNVDWESRAKNRRVEIVLENGTGDFIDEGAMIDTGLGDVINNSDYEMQ